MAVILITGCSSGIGKHCAIRLQEDGWDVIATARRPGDIKMLREAGLNAVYLDYTQTGSISSAVEAALEKGGGRIEALFNNGAYGQAGAVEDISTDVLRRQFEANFFGWHELTNQVLPHMRKAGQGRIVHCSSILGFVPYRWRGAYNASKFALEGLASTMRLELRGSGIHVSLIEPGPIESKFTVNGLKHFEENIDIENSVHNKVYRKELKRLQSEGGVNRFRLPPEAVYEKLRHALTSARPRAHYHVTVPTKFMGVAKRLLPQSLIDRLLLKSG
ncbi:SDR family oxidoreductase [Salaquimonas pukyongi]|uniref:SDR family oxidoreductase n=1 Tax=Salaquimonas pukyongi TaxID=2712698 RepID=UPI00096BB0E4|nr:SDR family oxidoreductase [Salaquimonas pukyongi]